MLFPIDPERLHSRHSLHLATVRPVSLDARQLMAGRVRLTDLVADAPMLTRPEMRWSYPIEWAQLSPEVLFGRAEGHSHRLSAPSQSEDDFPYKQITMLSLNRSSM